VKPDRRKQDERAEGGDSEQSRTAHCGRCAHPA
jgi:hypothetical protein